MKDKASANHFRDITREFILGVVKIESDEHEPGEARLLTENMNDPEQDYPMPGGGLGRGFVLARENLENALETLYQEVIDGATDEFDPSGEGVMIDETMKIAKMRAAKMIMSIVRNFFKAQ